MLCFEDFLKYDEPCLAAQHLQVQEGATNLKPKALQMMVVEKAHDQEATCTVSKKL